MTETDQPEQDPAPATEGVSRRVALFCGALAAAPLLFVLGWLITLMAQGARHDYPTVAPERTAARLTAVSQELYEATGFDRTVPPGVEDIGVSTKNTLDSDFCYPKGLRSLLNGSADGAYSLRHSWALPDVPKSEALPALRRLRDHLKAEGWTITEYGKERQSDEWELEAEKGEDRGVAFTWHADRDYFSGGAGTGCAYEPGWQEGDDAFAGSSLDPLPLRPEA